MHDPRTMLPVPLGGDRDADVLYAAKGRAVSSWENIEVALCYLYAMFNGEPWDKAEAYQRYGEPLNFKERADCLKRAAHSFFIENPDQEIEGRFCQLICAVIMAQPRRNEIVHSVLLWVPTKLGSEYFLVPPEYSARKFDENLYAKFRYTSVELKQFDQQFYELTTKLNLLAAQMHVRWPSTDRSRRFGPQRPLDGHQG